ncbi:hypothetical protein [Microbacterium xylanilyticum]
MPLTTRTAITAFDDVRHAARQSAPDAATVLVAWSRAHMSVAAVGLLDDDGRPLDPKPELLAMLTALFPVPVDEDLLRLAYPETLQAFAQGELPAAERVDGMTDGSGQLLFQIPVDEPEWARVTDNVLERVQAGLWVQDADIRDALWSVLSALGLPDAVVRVRRVGVARSFPDEPLFMPVELIGDPPEHRTMTWDAAKTWIPVHGAVEAIVELSSELAERQQRALVAQDVKEPQVLLEVNVTL